MSRNQPHAAAESPAPPSDLELMLYADGELEEPRLAEVEAYLSRPGPARTKIRALDLASALVRESAPAPADGLTDAIMARIQAEGAAQPAPVKLATVHALPVRATLPRSASKPANDGSRGIFTLAAVAFAAAAGLMLWGKAHLAQDPQAHLRPIPAQTPAQTSAVARVEPPAPARPVDAAEDDDHGVEVASVNFGSRTGSIFYVPKGVAASNATTTVVWLNDDAAGGE